LTRPQTEKHDRVSALHSELLAYIDSIEPMVASAHAQMQMKQANIFFLVEKNMCRPVLFCYRCCYAPA